MLVQTINQCLFSEKTTNHPFSMLNGKLSCPVESDAYDIKSKEGRLYYCLITTEQDTANVSQSSVSQLVELNILQLCSRDLMIRGIFLSEKCPKLSTLEFDFL